MTIVLLVLGAARAATVAETFPPPDGWQRVPADAFAISIQQREVQPGPVRTHDGRVVAHDALPIDLDLVPGDLQQCADTVIRLRAEWLRAEGRPVVFHATSGDPIPWSRWEAGERPFVPPAQSGLSWRAGNEGGWEAYLGSVFTWAGTRSLGYDTLPATEPRPGDVLVVPGSPGHAVVLIDVITRGGEVRVLVGEGYMPAQQFHVELGPEGGWWTWDGGVTLSHWDLPASGLRRFPK